MEREDRIDRGRVRAKAVASHKQIYHIVSLAVTVGNRTPGLASHDGAADRMHPLSENLSINRATSGSWKAKKYFSFRRQGTKGCPPREPVWQTQAPNLSAARAFALAATSSRFFGAAFVSSERRRRVEISAISSTAARNEASFPFDGLLKPLIFLTNWSEAARISTAVTGGSKLKRGLIFLHIQ